MAGWPNLAELIVGADGVNSVVRRRHAEAFQPDLDVRPAKFIWLGTTYPFEAFTFVIVENAHGVFQAHAYRFEEGLSTFIVECDPLSWSNAGFDRMNTEETVAACREMFAPWLGGSLVVGLLAVPPFAVLGPTLFALKPLRSARNLRRDMHRTTSSMRLKGVRSSG